MFQQFYDGGAEGYDGLSGRVPLHFSASLLRITQLKPGQNVLDVATGTGIVAEEIAHAIQPSGSLIGVDISRARHVSLEAADCQALRFDDEQFDVVICSLALMLFTDPARGAAEMRRVLKPGGRVAMTVETTAARSLTTRINTVIGRYVPSRAKAASIYYSLGEERLLRPVLELAGFSDAEVSEESHSFYCRCDRDALGRQLPALTDSDKITLDEVKRITILVIGRQCCPLRFSPSQRSSVSRHGSSYLPSDLTVAERRARWLSCGGGGRIWLLIRGKSARW